MAAAETHTLFVPVTAMLIATLGSGRGRGQRRMLSDGSMALQARVAVAPA